MHAGVAELADAYGSGPYGGNPMKVQVLSPAPLDFKRNPRPPAWGFFYLVPQKPFHTPVGVRTPREQGKVVSVKAARALYNAFMDNRIGNIIIPSDVNVWPHEHKTALALTRAGFHGAVIDIK